MDDNNENVHFSTSSFLKEIGTSHNSVQQSLQVRTPSKRIIFKSQQPVIGKINPAIMDLLMKTFGNQIKAKENSPKRKVPKEKSEKILEEKNPNDKLSNDKTEPLMNKKYCKICKIWLAKDSEKTVGARRHVLEHHLKMPMYMCSVCPYTSNYDKTNVTLHIRRDHAGKGKTISIPRNSTEELRWTRKCFSTRATREISHEESPPLTPEETKEEQDHSPTFKVEIEEKEECSPILQAILRDALEKGQSGEGIPGLVNEDISRSDENQDIQDSEQVSAIINASGIVPEVPTGTENNTKEQQEPVQQISVTTAQLAHFLFRLFSGQS